MKIKSVYKSVAFGCIFTMAIVVVSCGSKTTIAVLSDVSKESKNKTEDTKESIDESNDCIINRCLYVKATENTYALSSFFGGFNGRSSEGPQWKDENFWGW